MKEEKLKTITIGGRGDPHYTLCRGHVNATVFNKAYKAEGWQGDWVAKSELKHEYWIELKTKWKQSKENAKRAILVTVLYW